MSLLFSHDAVAGRGVATDAAESAIERKLSAALAGDVTTDSAACDAKARELEAECESIVGGGACVGISRNVVTVDDGAPFNIVKSRVAQFASKHGAHIVSAKEVPHLHGYEFTLSKAIAEDAADSAACDGLFEDMSRLDGNLDKAAVAIEACDIFSAPREVLAEVRKAKQAIKAAVDNLHKFVDGNKMY